MSLTSVFGMGSEPTAASGGKKEANEWQGSVSDEAASSARRAPGTPTGNRWTVHCSQSEIKVKTPHDIDWLICITNQ